jgi:hypothetical protein
MVAPTAPQLVLRLEHLVGESARNNYIRLHAIARILQDMRIYTLNEKHLKVIKWSPQLPKHLLGATNRKPA